MSREEVKLPPDAPTEAWRLQLLDIAFEASAAMPLFPHVKNRARGQEVVIKAALELDQPSRALRFSEGIVDNWRKGAGLARLAYYCGEKGEEEPIAGLLDRADKISRTSPDALDQGWRGERIRAIIARTHLLMGDADMATAISASMETSESGDVEAALARTVDVAALEPLLARVDQVTKMNDFDLTKNSLRACVEFYKRVYEDEEKRNAIEEKVKSAWGKLPAHFRIEYLVDMSATASKHGDTEKALALLDEAETLYSGMRWAHEQAFEIQAGLATARFRAGDPKGGQSRANQLFVDFNTQRAQIVDIFRADALRPLAEAYQAMGSTQTAKNIYRMALEEGVRNPNSRPRSEDLTATLCSMAVNGVEPDKAIWRLIEKTREGLGDPW